MKPSKIYFLKDFKKLGQTTAKLLAGFYPKGAEVIVKIHFGEPGNKNAFTPTDIEPIVKALKSLGVKPTFIDTPVAYHSPRNNVKGYEKAVKEKGWDKLAPFVISDKSKKIKTRDFTAQVCKELIEAENVLVISHVKGHECSGFGGVVKNFGMGAMLPATKQTIHDLCKPVMKGNCVGCGTCARLCPGGAIKIVKGKAKFNLEKCYGCSICELNCPQKALAPRQRIFDDLLAQGAAAAINHLPQKTYYISIIKNISKKCDCCSNPGEIIAKDVGVLFGDNPVAMDQASVDLVNKVNKRNVFLEANHKDPYLQINACSGYTDKTSQYKLEKI